MKLFKGFSSRQIGILAGLIFLFIVLIGSAIGFLLYNSWRHPAAGSTPTFSPTTPSGSVSVSTSTLLQTTIPTFTSSANIPPTSTISAAATNPTTTIYVVQTGDTLSAIASQFGTSVDAIKQANNLTSDTIYSDQTLTIPSFATPTPAIAGNVYIVTGLDTIESIATQHGLSAGDLRAANFMAGDALLPGQQIVLPDVTPVPVRPYQFSINQGDLTSAYPLTFHPGRFTLHYTPNTFPAQDPQSVYDLIQRSVDHIESLFQIQLSGSFDVYVAGSLFEHPDSQLRGISFSVYRRSFFLDDGTGSAADQQYISAHELTHLFLWNTFGQPASTMLSEGAAVYSGMDLIASSNDLSLDTFCAAYQQAGRLPQVSSPLAFTGHIYDLENYYASGCFVGYLVKNYGVQAFSQVYHGGDYTTVYGETLPALEQDWIASLQLVELPADLDPAKLVQSVNSLETSYANFMPGFSGTSAQLHAYYHMDLARLALLNGQFNDMQTDLADFQSALIGP